MQENKSKFMSGSLYEKYGGFAVVNRIVMAFYDALLDSDELGNISKMWI